MTGQREGFLGDILDKVKDVFTDDDNSNPTPPPPPAPAPAPEPSHPGPPVTPQCCGPNPKFLKAPEASVTDSPVVHDADCPNHPDNLAKEEVVA
jgi:hypothetical protein